MAKAQSLVSFIRKQLGFKGPTEHSGRGYWMCYVDTTWAEFSARIKEVTPKLQAKGLVTTVAYHESGDSIDVTFKIKVEPGLASIYQQTVVTITFDKTGIDRFGMYTVGAMYNIDN